MTRAAQDSIKTSSARVHAPMTSVVLMGLAPARAVAEVTALEAGLAGFPHELLVVYRKEAVAAALETDAALGLRLRLVKAEDDSDGGALRAAVRAAAGDVILPMVRPVEEVGVFAALAAAVRGNEAAVAILNGPRGSGGTGRANFLLNLLAGMGAWQPLTGLRAYSAEFLERQEIPSAELAAVDMHLLVEAQFEHVPICEVALAKGAAEMPGVKVELAPLRPALRRALLAPVVVWGLWVVMIVAAIGGELWPMWRQQAFEMLPALANLALPAAGAFAFILAVRRVRGRMRIADGFFPLVLLNPILFARGAGFDHMLLATGLLALMAGGIIAMKRDDTLRYLVVTALALLLTRLSESFIILLPALVLWLLIAGYRLAKSKVVRDRRRGFLIMIAGEVALMLFLLALVLIEPTETPHPRDLFSTIVSFTEFPLLVLGIVGLALGWRKGPHGTTPPYFPGMLALLVGLLTMILNNFQMGTLPEPGSDQTVVVLCLVYTVSALHGPRRLQWVVPPVLLVGAVVFTLFR